MLPAEEFWVIATGKRYVRQIFEKSDGFIVGQQIAHALRFATAAEAIDAAAKLKAMWVKHAAKGGEKIKPVTVQHVIVENIPIE